MVFFQSQTEINFKLDEDKYPGSKKENKTFKAEKNNSIIFGDSPLSKKYEAIEITVNIPIRLSSSVNTFHNNLAGLT